MKPACIYPQSTAKLHHNITKQAPEQEHGGNSKNSVKFGESGKDKRVTGYIMAIAEGNHTVSTYLSLTYGAEQADNTYKQTHAENAGSLENCNTGCEEVLQKEEAHEAVKTLRTGKSRKYHTATEHTLVFLQSTYRGVGRIGYAECTSDTRQSNHECDADVSYINWFHNTCDWFLINIFVYCFFAFFSGENSRWVYSNPAFL